MKIAAYGEDWEARGTKLQSIGIIVAPEIFQLKERIYRSDGRTIMEGSRYFTWPIASDMIVNEQVPAGWRMITPDESEAIKARYNNSNFGLLVLGLDGFIAPNDMVAYNHYPAGGERLITRRGEAGYYWINGHDSPLYPNIIENSGLKLRTTSFYLSYGLPLLLVKDL